ncbi:MAG TPA: phosphatase PAP2 family protein [Bacteroidales bacterium]|nr:phosphatase PAP2 family protein [Bacteroidales bacterium]
MNSIENIDRVIFNSLNGLNASWLDTVMQFLSSFWFWMPMVIIVIYLFIRIFKKSFWMPLVAVILCFAVTDQSSNLSKKTFKRYRPTHNTEISENVHTVDGYRGGQYGFFSGHAANSFGLALLSLLFIRKKYYTIIVLVWACIVSYSRIYLGVHYPSDICVGAIYGSLIAFLLYFLSKKIFKTRLLVEQKSNN